MSVNYAYWSALLDSLYDRDRHGIGHLLPGQCMLEWWKLVDRDVDEIDRMYLDLDICGGE